MLSKKIYVKTSVKNLDKFFNNLGSYIWSTDHLISILFKQKYTKFTNENFATYMLQKLESNIIHGDFFYCATKQTNVYKFGCTKI